jgi:hypothetical protein
MNLKDITFSIFLRADGQVSQTESEDKLQRTSQVF